MAPLIRLICSTGLLLLRCQLTFASSEAEEKAIGCDATSDCVSELSSSLLQVKDVKAVAHSQWWWSYSEEASTSSPGVPEVSSHATTAAARASTDVAHLEHLEADTLPSLVPETVSNSTYAPRTVPEVSSHVVTEAPLNTTEADTLPSLVPDTVSNSTDATQAKNDVLPVPDTEVMEGDTTALPPPVPDAQLSSTVPPLVTKAPLNTTEAGTLPSLVPEVDVDGGELQSSTTKSPEVSQVFLTNTEAFLFFAIDLNQDEAISQPECEVFVSHPDCLHCLQKLSPAKAVSPVWVCQQFFTTEMPKLEKDEFVTALRKVQEAGSVVLDSKEQLMDPEPEALLGALLRRGAGYLSAIDTGAASGSSFARRSSSDLDGSVKDKKQC